MPTVPSSRRDFMKQAAAAGVLLTGLPRTAKARVDTKLRVLSIGVTGTIGGTDRKIIASHPKVEIAGLCDIDAGVLAQAATEHPAAFTCADYREAFDKHAGKFDAAIVATPDHSHCAIMTMALARGKHVYGQKPLVQQLEELEILRRAAAAKPELATQTGAQRIEHAARRAAVDILRSGALGKVIEVHIAFGGGARAGGFYFSDGTLGDPIEPPAGFDYDLWLNGAAHEPCRPGMVQRQWRSWWNFGGGQIADWSVHLTDVLFYAFPELKSPVRVCTRTPSRDLSHFHAQRVLSTLTYPVSRDRFAGTTCNFHFYDSGMMPDRAQLGLGEGKWPGGILTIVVCEGGVLVLAPEGPLEIWRDGVMTDGLQWQGLPAYEKFNHWHAWVDKIVGKPDAFVQSPFSYAAGMAEAGLLCSRAARFPQQELLWDKSKLAFTNHEEATKTCVTREYRKGFEPPVFS